MEVAVVGHVEWIEFGRVDRVPAPGDIAHAVDVRHEPGGAGAVAAVQLAKLAGGCTLFTALGDDDVGGRMRRELGRLGVRVEAMLRDEPTRRAVTMIDDDGERTILTLGDRLHPVAADPLPWNELERASAAFFTAGDADALRRARAARVLVATSRMMDTLAEADARLDAVVGSAGDPAERYDPVALSHPPGVVVSTEGAEGGRYLTAAGIEGRYPGVPAPGPVVDTYGAGDSFMGGLTYALGKRMALPRALDLAARCGAASVTGSGPYERQLTAEDVRDVPV
ncbi:MAG: PfkB family carbohydrate kinase [Actinomycetota bacterium]